MLKKLSRHAVKSTIKTLFFNERAIKKLSHPRSKAFIPDKSSGSTNYNKRVENIDKIQSTTNWGFNQTARSPDAHRSTSDADGGWNYVLTTAEVLWSANDTSYLSALHNRREYSRRKKSLQQRRGAFARRLNAISNSMALSSLMVEMWF